MGWRILWPENEPWPRCDATLPSQHRREFEQALARARSAKASDIADRTIESILRILESEGGGEPYLPILQIRRDQFPDFPFPGDSDLFQLLWCPAHWVHEGPGHLAFWRKESVLGPLRTENVPFSIEPVFECVLDPEAVPDFPSVLELAQLGKPELLNEGHFENWATVPGTKLFGYADWIQYPEVPNCSRCKRSMRLLVSISSAEFGHGVSKLRWAPAEEQKQIRELEARLHGRTGGREVVDELRALDLPHGWMIGDVGNAYLFHCAKCPGGLTASRAESS
jgi:hypothetical protein